MPEGNTMRIAVRTALGAGLLGLSLAAAAQTPPPPPQPLGAPPVPAANPLTPAKIQLGQALFWDEQLSLTGTVACGTCHRPASGGSDPRSATAGAATRNPGADLVFGTPDDVRGSAGVSAHDASGLYGASSLFGVAAQVTSRKSPSAVNAAYAPLLFWDGRAGGSFLDPATGQVLIANGGALETQSLVPLLNPAEMAHAGETANDLAARVAALQPLDLAENVPAALQAWIAGRRYPALFQEAFGSPGVSAARIALALASYERTLSANQAPIDSEFGGTPTLTELERQGQQLFIANDCAACHAGSLFSDSAFHYIGVRPANEDTGRFAVTGNPADTGAFRTPSLRNVALRAPYMHDGRFATLEEVVDFYNRGGDFSAPNKDPRVRPRNLTPAQKTALLAFLRRPLTDPRTAAESGPFERPHLYTESSHVPTLQGTPLAGSNGLAPRLVALEPPRADNRNFTVAVDRGRAGAAAVLVVAHADPGLAPGLPAGDVAQVPVTLDAAGSAAVNLDLSTLVRPGDVLYGRWYLADAGVAGGYAVSAAFRASVYAGGDRVFGNGFE